MYPSDVTSVLLSVERDCRAFRVVMPFKDPEAKRAWRIGYRERQRESRKRFYSRNRERVLAKEKADRAAYRAAHPKPMRNPIKRRASQSANRQRLRADAIQALGGMCERCGISDPRVLQFDHRHPLRRATTKRDPSKNNRGLLQAIVADPSRQRIVIALLCANCHVLKTRTNGEQRSDYAGPIFGELEIPDAQLALLKV